MNQKAQKLLDQITERLKTLDWIGERQEEPSGYRLGGRQHSGQFYLWAVTPHPENKDETLSSSPSPSFFVSESDLIFWARGRGAFVKAWKTIEARVKYEYMREEDAEIAPRHQERLRELRKAWC